MDDWREFEIRKTRPLSARDPIGDQRWPLQPFLDERMEHLAEPVIGVTTDGTRVADLFPLRQTGVDTSPIREAATALMTNLSADQIEAVSFPIDSDQWRTWLNVSPNLLRHGLLLEGLDDTTRELGLDILRTTLSARGFEQARGIMIVNEMLAELTEHPDRFGEWPYFLSLFGEPTDEGPWGWQLDGHHLNLNCMVVGDQLVLSPAFMGSEPRTVPSGSLAGSELFTLEEDSGLALVRSLNEDQRAQAILGPSILPGDLPPELQHPFDGRMQAGAFLDNAVVPTAGIQATELTVPQRELLRNLAASYVGWTSDGHAEVTMSDVMSHLDDTWFCWLGGTDDDSVFYYRVQSPVILIEFDHHPGLVFDTKVPTRHHVHTMVRTPNGGDYGTDLLRQHHEKFDHSNGQHRHRHPHSE